MSLNLFRNLSFGQGDAALHVFQPIEHNLNLGWGLSNGFDFGRTDDGDEILAIRTDVVVSLERGFCKTSCSLIGSATGSPVVKPGCVET